MYVYVCVCDWRLKCLFMVYSRAKCDGLKMYVVKRPLTRAVSMSCCALGAYRQCLLSVSGIT